MKVLLDANVILDVLLDRKPWIVESQLVCDACQRGELRGHVVATAVTNMFYIARKIVGRPVALRGVCECLVAFDILAVDRAVLENAAKLLGSDFEDDVSISCAVSSGMDFIVTRDVSGFVQSPVPAVSPAVLLSRLPLPPAVP